MEDLNVGGDPVTPVTETPVVTEETTTPVAPEVETEEVK